MKSQKEIYNEAYELGNTLWDKGDKVIEDLLESDFKKLLENLRLKLARGKILNLGSGTGENNKRLINTCTELINIDLSNKAIELARRKNDDPRVKFVLGDIQEFEFKEKSFDYVEGIAILHHIKEKDKVIKKIYKTLKDNCWCLFLEPGILNPQAFFP